MPRADPSRILRYLKSHPGENLRRYEILTVLVDFAKDVNGPTPTELGWSKLFNSQAREYGFKPMHRSTFLRHVRQLIEEGYIEKRRGVICVINADWQPPEELPLIREDP